MDFGSGPALQLVFVFAKFEVLATLEAAVGFTPTIRNMCLPSGTKLREKTNSSRSFPAYLIMKSTIQDIVNFTITKHVSQ